MFDMEVKMSSGDINVQTTSERGHTPEELSANAVAKIINISETADPIIKHQAEARKNVLCNCSRFKSRY